MKRSRNLLAGIAVLVVTLAALVWWLPARWALPWLEPRLHGLQLQQVAGSVWQGRAGQVVLADGEPLGAVQWSISRRALWGDIELDLSLQQPQLSFQGHMHALSSTQDEWRHVTLSLDPAMLNAQPWLHAKPDGRLQFTIERAQLQGGWPLQLDATAHWANAAIQTTHGVATLGDMSAQINADNGVLHATLSDDGDGLLHMSGLLSFSPLGWTLQITLKPRRPDAVVTQWLHTLGRPAADGSVHLSYRGGLAQMDSNQ